MSPPGHFCFLFLLLGWAVPSRTQDLSVETHLGTSMAPPLMEKDHSTPASSSGTALSPTTSEHQLTSGDPTKYSADTGQTQPEKKMETTSEMRNLDPPTVGSRTRTPKPSASSDEYTLRKRGLLAAAVLFITGIVILTSDRCRQFRWCRRQQRSAYRVAQA
ncbi:FXYD domain-containing ion transport regulator 5 isoform X2 [Monodelphis domestica]|uniref:FXYD domain-containing ion transport regulator 5 isoform X2 n=1 Tax=Monodelphis domestica TaxID=13616 RepID=UPI0024E1C2CA|nr:FXYD domain-containing ion transport regulator 5 isoform X2 [Monodelphis domestica]